MTEEHSPHRSSQALDPLVVVPDANVFTREAWVERLIRASDTGMIRIVWSPKTLEEIGRVRLWIWIKRTLRTTAAPSGSSAWKALWSRYFSEAHAWFARISLVAQVVDDQPPHEPAWAEPHPDPNDAWLWNGARRVHADAVLTANLKDAPPVDAQGVQWYEGIVFMHPDSFIGMLNVWEELDAAGEFREMLIASQARAIDQGSRLDVPGLALLRTMLRRTASEPPAEAGGSSE